MARIDEEQILVRFSKLIRDDEDPLAKDVLTESLRVSVETFLQDLVSDDILVEANIASSLSGVPYNVPVEIIPDFYQLSASSGSITEGQQISIDITADSSVGVGNAVPYTITGVASTDIVGGALTGTATVNGGQVTTLTFTTVDSEGANGTQFFTFTLDESPEDAITITVNPSV